MSAQVTEWAWEPQTESLAVPTSRLWRSG